MEACIEKTKAFEKKPSLLLHVCCAPCATAVLECLAPHFALTLFFYNPNITGSAEYEKRKAELIRYIREKFAQTEILDGPYEPERDFFPRVKGLESEPEGGARCGLCYELRLRETVKRAKADGFDYFGTVLSISPRKNAAKINKIGAALSEAAGVQWLPADFKKKDRYLQSIRLSKAAGLYRQDFCGCVFSLQQKPVGDKGQA
ncbi:MAG: epoxyqueuosine reductase QueH [Fusobacteriaceae bacterium]|nr:epoxyqueuosine reductase QueH [Fusobacteriaceae bacterium]